MNPFFRDIPNFIPKLRQDANIIIEYRTNTEKECYHNGKIKVIANDNANVNVTIVNFLNIASTHLEAVENEIKNIKLIVNRLRIEMVKQGNMLSVQDIVDILAVDVLGVIPDDESIVISTNKGEPLVYRGKSLAAEAFKNIVQRILDKDVPFLELDTKKSFMLKLKNIFGN